MRPAASGIGARLLHNWKSGLTVSLVSIPLSISLAVASQATPVAGIITAIWAGLFAALFGGSHFNIVGPTGALSGILAAYAIVHGAGALPMLALMTGALCLAAFALRLQRFMVFVPASAMHGFTVAVAFIIAFNQFNFATGISGLAKHERFVENLWESFTHLQLVQPAALAVFAVFLVGLFVLLRLTPKFPGAITLAPVGILLGWLSETERIPFALQTLGSRYPDMTAKLFEMPTFFFDIDLLKASFAVALIAILETLLSARIADGMTKTRHDDHKEMLGLSLANIASGLMGGLPATAALARTSLNVKSGADHRTSAVVSSACIAAISLLLFAFFRFIPLAVIAAILVFVAYRMVEFHHLARMFRADRRDFVLSMIVAVVCVWEDPIVGILLGTAVSLLLFVERLSRGQFAMAMNVAGKGMVREVAGEDASVERTGADTVVYSIKGALAYLNAQSHLRRLEGLGDDVRNVVLRLRETSFLDLDGAEMLEEMIDVLRRRGKKVLVTGTVGLEGMLDHCAPYQELKKGGLVFDKASQALEHLGHPSFPAGKIRA
jgi:SulP family sulfate permease